MRVEVVGEEEAELEAVIAHYEEIEPGLGVRFKEEARAAIRWIGEHPETPRVRRRAYRRVNLRVFPYYLPYFIWADAVWILAVAHGHRQPEYWIKRKKRVSI